MNPYERPFPLSKNALDTINSVAWFAMDASWMLESPEISFIMIIPTILSAIWLCYIEKRLSVTFINVAILSWICMNISWMFAEILSNGTYLVMAKVFFVIGVAFVAAAVFTSKNLTETFSHFRRFRTKNKSI